MSTGEGRAPRSAEPEPVPPSVDRAGIFEAVLQSLGEAVFLVDPSDRVIVLANRAAERLFRTPKEGLVGASTRMLYESEESFRRFGEISEAELERGGIFSTEYRFRRADGDVFDAEVTVTPIVSGDWPNGVVSVVRDLSKERRAEAETSQVLAALGERVKELRAIHTTATVLADQESSLDSVLERIVVALPEAWQYPEATVASITYGDVRVTTEGYREPRWHQTAEIRGLHGRVGALTVGYVDERPEEDEGPFLREERALVNSLAFLIQSYCRSREQHEEAERDRDRFRQLFRTGPIAMSLTLAEDGTFVDVNERMVELTGYARDELIGRNSVELGLFDVEERMRMARMLEARGGIEGFRLSYRRRGEEARIAFGSIQPMTIEGRRHWFTSMIDATAQTRVEEERAQLAERARTLERLGEIGNLAGGVAHDFNNLLLPILINVELAIPEAAGEARARLQEIQDAALRGRELTKKLLAVGRRQELHVSAIDVNALVRAAEPLLRRLVPESIGMRLGLDDTEVCARADATLLEQIVVNLVVNARDAVGRDGHITVSTYATVGAGGDGTGDAAIELGTDAPSSDLVWLEVSDDGPGIPPEIHARIFEPFFTTKEGSGTGLGLATVLGIVRQHEGRIRVDTRAGSGTRFRVGLPRASSGANARGDATNAPATLDATAGHGRTVLVVEDDPAVRRVTVRALGAYGFTVVQAANATEALATLRGPSPGIDIVVSDMVMPGMTGLELREALRDVAPGLPVLFVSGYSARVLSDHGIDRDSVRIVEKPFSPESLARAVFETLPGSSPGRGEA